MICSRNELTALLNKAAVGCGYPVGLAQDVGRAGAWLVCRNLDGVGAVLEALGSGPDHTIIEQSDHWIFEDVCAGHRGPAIFDLLIADPGTAITLSNVDSPLLLVGLAGIAGLEHGRSFRFVFSDGCTALVTGAEVVLSGLVVPGTDVVLNSQPAEHCEDGYHGGLEVSDTLWRRASLLAAATYVPATDESRLKGAGAGLTDND